MTEAKARVIQPGDMPPRPMSRPYATSIRMVDDTLGADAVDLQMNVLPPDGEPGPYHLHTKSENVYYVVSGHLRVRLGDEVHYLGPGGVAFIPPGIPHDVSNPGTEEARLLEIYAPPHPDFVLVDVGRDPGDSEHPDEA